MALIVKDRVLESSTSTGTGSFTLTGAQTGYQSFSAIGNGNTTYYTIQGKNPDGTLTGEWEVGEGTWSTGNTLARNTVLSNSLGTTAKVPFSSGDKDVFVTYPSEKAIYQDFTGNVGIGTNTPQDTLEVNGAIKIYNSTTNVPNVSTLTFGPALDGGDFGFITWNNNVGLKELQLYTDAGFMSFYANALERMRISANGNVGIGNNNPAYVLDVRSAATAVAIHATDATNADFYVDFPSAGITRLTTEFGAAGAFVFANGTTKTERMRIDASGNVGIGTASPATKLDIFGNQASPIVLRLRNDSPSTSAGTKVIFGNYTGVDTAYLSNIFDGATFNTRVWQQTAGFMAFGTNDAERMRIHSSGGVSIGSTTDAGASNLSVAGAIVSTRITPRVSTTTSSATPTINTDTTDQFGLTAQAVDITSFTTNLSGTPTDGQKLWIYIVGTAARAITWGASFESSTATLPTTTVTTNRLDVGFVWNAATSKWRCVAVA